MVQNAKNDPNAAKDIRCDLKEAALEAHVFLADIVEESSEDEALPSDAEVLDPDSAKVLSVEDPVADKLSINLNSLNPALILQGWV